MKYELPWGEIVTYEELRDLYLAKVPNATELRFGFWLEFKIEQGLIVEWEGDEE